MAQKSDYEAIFTNLGSTTGDSEGKTYDANVNAYLTTGVGGSGMVAFYWSATKHNNDYSWGFYSYCGYMPATLSFCVRPVLGF